MYHLFFVYLTKNLSRYNVPGVLLDPGTTEQIFYLQETIYLRRQVHILKCLYEYYNANVHRVF